MSTFPPCHCEICIPKSEKCGNRTMPLPHRNTKNFQTSNCKHQSPSNHKTRLSTKLSMTFVEVKREMKSKIEQKTTPKVQSKVQTKFRRSTEPKQYNRRVLSPARSFNAFEKDFKAVDSRGKPVVKTPTNFRPKSLLAVQSKLNQSKPSMALKSTPITKNKAAKAANVKVIPKKLVPIIDIERNENEMENMEKYDVNSNIVMNAVTEVSTEKDVVPKVEIGQSVPVCNEIEKWSPTKIDSPADDLSSIPILEITQILEYLEIKLAESTIDDDIKTTASQSKWSDEVLDLLNTGSESQIRSKLVTVGPKYALQITKCREIRGKFEQIEDLKTKLGWTEKVYQNFRSKNFL